MPSFLYARYATSSSSSLYVGYTLGPAALVFGAVVNPRTGYRELIGGGVSRAMWGRQSITVAFAAAEATESRYLQGYLLPAFALGRVSISGTLELYEPLESGGTRQFDVNPGTVLLRVTDRVALGGCYALGLTSGAGPRHRAGPVLQLAIPRGALTLELLRGVARAKSEVRMSIEAAF